MSVPAVNSLLATRQVLENTPSFDSLKPADLAIKCITFLGLIHDPAIAGPAANELRQRRIAVLETAKAVTAGTFEQHIEAVIAGKGSYSGVDSGTTKTLSLRQLGNLPMPLSLSRCFPGLLAGIAQQWKTKGDRCKALLFQLLDTGDHVEVSEEQQAELEQFLYSKAAYYGPGGRPVSWYEVVTNFGRDCGQLFGVRCERVFSFLKIRKLVVAPAPDPFPLQPSSFREYLVLRTLHATQLSLKLQLPETVGQTLVEILRKNEEARCDLTFLLVQPKFLTWDHIPGDRSLRNFLEAVQAFLKTRQTIPNLPNELLESLYFADNHEDLSEIEEHLEQLPKALEVFKARFSHLEIPKERIFKFILCLAKLENLDGFLDFLSRVEQRELFPIDAPFLMTFLFDGFNLSNFGPYIQLVDIFAEIIKCFTLPVNGPKPAGKFWVKLFQKPDDIRDDETPVASFKKIFQDNIGSSLNAKEVFFFYSVVLAFLKGYITSQHIDSLKPYPLTPEDFWAVLAHPSVQNTDFKHLPSGFYLKDRYDWVEALQEEWGLSLRVAMILYFEFLKLQTLEIQKQIALLKEIESYTLEPLCNYRDEAFEWLRYHPNSEPAISLLERFRQIRSQILEHVGRFIIPIELYDQFGSAVSELSALTSSSPDNSAYLQAIASLGALMQRATLPTSPYAWAAHICLEAIQGSPFLSLERGEENRTTGYPSLICPFVSSHPESLSILRRWITPPRQDMHLTYIVHLTRVSTGQTYAISANLEIPWETLQADPSILPMIQTMAFEMGAEASHPPGSGQSSDSPLQAALRCYPGFAKTWHAYTPQPGPLSKEEIGNAAFEFVKRLKIQYRKGLLFLANALPPKLGELRLTQHTYWHPNKLSLYPPDRVITKSMEEGGSVGRECDTQIQRILECTGASAVAELELPFEKGRFRGSLKVAFHPQKIDDKLSLNQVTLGLGDLNSTIRYGNFTRDKESFSTLLRRQLLEVMLWKSI
jgi:hypothetical protein